MDFSVCNAIEQSGLASIGQTYNSTFKSHFPCFWEYKGSDKSDEKKGIKTPPTK
jgi:hypothetical protein